MRARLTLVLIVTLLAGCGSISQTSSSTPTTAQPKPGDPVSKLDWTTVGSTSVPGLEAAGGSIDGKVYSFGGYFRKEYVATNVAEVYDPTANKWADLPKVPRPVTHAALVSNGREFILAGGNSAAEDASRINAIDNVFSFNVDTKQWSELPKLPSATAGGGMAKVGSVLHFFGGSDNNRKEQPNHWTLDLDNLNAGWKKGSAFPYPRTHFSTVAIDSSIYVIGGQVGINNTARSFADVYRYDTTTDRWNTMASLPTPLSHATDATVVYNDRIWTFGGEKSYNATLASVLVYDPTFDVWTTNTDLPSPRFAGIATNVNGDFYFARGSMDSTVMYKGSPE